MNKNLLRLEIIVLFVGLCCGCNGNITRDIRHAGFTMGGTFECSNFFPQDKEDTDYEKIRYLTGSRLVNTEGKIYEFNRKHYPNVFWNSSEKGTYIKPKEERS